MTALRLAVRSPRGLLFEGEVRSIRAEDESGWFGICPGREDVVAILPAGLFVFEDDEGEGFVAMAGGLLDLKGDSCRVLVREAVVSRSLEDVAELHAQQIAARKARAEGHRDALKTLARQALVRMLAEVRA